MGVVTTLSALCACYLVHVAAFFACSGGGRGRGSSAPGLIRDPGTHTWALCVTHCEIVLVVSHAVWFVLLHHFFTHAPHLLSLQISYAAVSFWVGLFLFLLIGLVLCFSVFCHGCDNGWVSLFWPCSVWVQQITFNIMTISSNVVLNQSKVANYIPCNWIHILTYCKITHLL